MMRVIRLWIGLITLMLFSACSTTNPSYIPQTINTPGLKKEGDKRIGVISSTGGYNVNGSYALSDEIAVMGGAQVFVYKDQDTTALNKTGQRPIGVQIEAAIGYYKWFDEDKLFDFYVGYGHSQLSTFLINGPAQRFTVQSTIGYQKERFESFFSMKITHFRAYQSVLEIEEKGDIQSLIFEPTVSYRFNLMNRWDIFAQAGLSFPLEMEGFGNRYPFQTFPIVFGIGLEYNLTERSGKRRKKKPHVFHEGNMRPGI